MQAERTTTKKDGADPSGLDPDRMELILCNFIIFSPFLRDEPW